MSSILNIYQSLVENMPLWFQQGGFIMWILLLLSFLTTLISIDRLFFWLTYFTQKEHFILQECYAALHKKQKTNALLATKKLNTPALKLLATAIADLPFYTDKKMRSYADSQINMISRGQAILRYTIITAPLFGLLGTIISIILSAAKIGQLSTFTEMIPFIANTLIPLASGLSVSLFAIIPLSLFNNWLKNLTLHLYHVIAHFDYICQLKKLSDQAPQTHVNKNNSNKNNTNKNSEAELPTKSVSEQIPMQMQMPYHYEFSEETGEVNVTIHEQSETIKRVSAESIANMYNQEPSPSEKEINNINDQEK